METIRFNTFLSHLSAINGIIFSGSEKITKEEYQIIYSFVEEFSDKQSELSNFFLEERNNPELDKLSNLTHNFCKHYPKQEKCLKEKIYALKSVLLEIMNNVALPSDALIEADEKLKCEQKRMRVLHNTDDDDYDKAKKKYLKENRKHNDAYNEACNDFWNCSQDTADKLFEICKFIDAVLESDSIINCEFIGKDISDKIFRYVCTSNSKILNCKNSNEFYYMVNLMLNPKLYKNRAEDKAEQRIRAFIDYLALKIAPEHRGDWINHFSNLLGISYVKFHHDKTYYESLMKL